MVSSCELIRLILALGARRVILEYTHTQIYLPAPRRAAQKTGRGASHYVGWAFVVNQQMGGVLQIQESLKKQSPFQGPDADP